MHANKEQRVGYQHYAVAFQSVGSLKEAIGPIIHEHTLDTELIQGK